MFVKSVLIPVYDICKDLCNASLYIYESRREIKVTYGKESKRISWSVNDGFGKYTWLRLVQDQKFLISVARAIVLTYGCAIVNGNVYSLSIDRITSYPNNLPPCVCKNITNPEGEDIIIPYTKYATSGTTLYSYKVATLLHETNA